MSTETTTQQGPRTTILAVLRNTKTLLEARGWTAKSQGRNFIFSREEGPLTLTQALWQAGSVDGKVHIPVIDNAGRVLCVCARLDAEAACVELGRWSAVEGRTQAEVLALLDRAIATGERAFTELANMVEAMMAECGEGAGDGI